MSLLLDSLSSIQIICLSTFEAASSPHRLDRNNMDFLSFNLLPLITTYGRDFANLLSQPFHVFGTLAVAESQDQHKSHERHRHRSVPRKTSHSRENKTVMRTASITSILSLYRELPRAKSRLLKVALLNVLTQRAISMADIRLQGCVSAGSKRGRAIRTASTLILSVLIAPVRLLSTEISVFERFDWRFLQMNSKMLPIFIPNLACTALQLGLSKILTLILDKCSTFAVRVARDTQLPIWRTGPEILLLLGGGFILLYCRIISEVVRVRTDLLILNSEQSVLPIDESFEGGLTTAAVSNEHYDVMDTVRRYIRIALIPETAIYTIWGILTILHVAWPRSVH